MSKFTGCNVDGCQRDYKGLGYCNPHYQRFIKTGDPLGSRRPTTEARFWSMVDKTATCWNWTSYKTDEGYGIFGVMARTFKAHRYSWELAHGPIPDELVLDHACLNEGCVNPGHLRPSTVKQNNENRRGALRTSGTGVRGVSWRPKLNKFIVHVGHNGKRYHGGLFATIAEAEAKAVAMRLHFFTHNEVDRAA